jgi:hypothetical protein
MATDIAFALAVLAVISTHLPAALLTLAVVDGLGTILVIAVFYTTDLNSYALAGAFTGLAVFYTPRPSTHAQPAPWRSVGETSSRKPLRIKDSPRSDGHECAPPAGT